MFTQRNCLEVKLIGDLLKDVVTFLKNCYFRLISTSVNCSLFFLIGIVEYACFDSWEVQFF